MASCFRSREEPDAEEHPLVDKSAQPSYSQTTDDTAESTGQCGDARGKEDTSNIRTQIIGCISCVVSLLGFCVGMTFSQLLNRSIPHSELNGLRYSVQLLVASVAVAINRKCDVRVKRDQIGWLIVASFAMVLANYSSYGYTYYLPLGIATGVSRSILFLLLYGASCVITRRMQWYYIVAGLVCITGVLLVVQPPFIFHNTGNVLVNTDDSYHSPCHLYTVRNQTVFSNDSIDIRHDKDNLLGYTLVLFDALADTVFVLILNYRLSDIDTTVFMFWSSLCGVVTSYSIMAVMETPTLPHLQVCIWFLAAHMFISGTYGFFYAYSVKIIPEKLMALIATSIIPIQFLLQYTVLAGMYVGRANAVELMGAVLVFAGNIIVPVTETVQYWRQTISTH